jgi:hypothetical protein
MAEYLIQDTTLDAIADAIQAKSGAPTPMTPAEMVAEIAAIPSGGGGFTWQDYFDGVIPSGRIELRGNITRQNVFQLSRNVSNSFTLYLTATVINATNALSSSGTVAGIVLPYLSSVSGSFAFSENRMLSFVDFGVNCNYLPQNAMYQNSVLNLLIFRSTDIVSLANTNAIANQTKFSSGQSGGTIYIPKSLYDHLGDGTALDYKAATNLSTIDGYGTITWAQIEGSIYETQYADGTPITSA